MADTGDGDRAAGGRPPTRVYRPRTAPPAGATPLNTTSRAAGWSAALSPFTLGPVTVWPSPTKTASAQNVENAWQFSKVYAADLDAGEIGRRALEWMWAGWADPVAHRFPKGRGAVPAFSLHRGQRLGYVAARLCIYVPAYVEGLLRSPRGREALLRLVAEGRAGPQPLALCDFDGYDHVGLGRGLAEVFLDPSRKAGHSFVLAGLVDGTLTAEFRRACATAVAAGTLPPELMPSLPDLAPLRTDERDAAMWRAGGTVHRRPRALGPLAARYAAALGPGGAAAVDYARRDVNVHGWKPERRLTAFYGDPGTRYKYSKRDNVARPWTDDPSGILAEIRDVVALIAGFVPNLVLINYYADGSECIGPHSDDERDLVAGSPIASISLGADRTIDFLPLRGDCPHRSFTQPDGTILVMGTGVQSGWKHEVVANRQITRPRINLTFRHVALR